MDITLSLLREIAAKASCDPRTVEKVLRGEKVRGLAQERARAELKSAGIQISRLNTEDGQVR